MRFPVLRGLIDRRLLINFTADSDVVAKILPPPFRPKLYKGKSIVGICLIRLKHIRPKGVPSLLGLSSENAAHRIAVEWEEEGQLREGVFIPRRDTSSLINHLAGGRVFPGTHHHAQFEVKEEGNRYHIAFTSSDGTSLSIEAEEAGTLDNHSIFENLEEASAFFKRGSIGFSPHGNSYEGVELTTYHWKPRPLGVEAAHSSFFENKALFPTGSIAFDNALLMTKLEHEWKPAGKKAGAKVRD